MAAPEEKKKVTKAEIYKRKATMVEYFSRPDPKTSKLDIGAGVAAPVVYQTGIRVTDEKGQKRFIYVLKGKPKMVRAKLMKGMKGWKKDKKRKQEPPLKTIEYYVKSIGTGDKLSTKGLTKAAEKKGKKVVEKEGKKLLKKGLKEISETDEDDAGDDDDATEEPQEVESGDEGDQDDDEEKDDEGGEQSGEDESASEEDGEEGDDDDDEEEESDDEDEEEDDEHEKESEGEDGDEIESADDEDDADDEGEDEGGDEDDESCMGTCRKVARTLCCCLRWCGKQKKKGKKNPIVRIGQGIRRSLRRGGDKTTDKT